MTFLFIKNFEKILFLYKSRTSSSSRRVEVSPAFAAGQCGSSTDHSRPAHLALLLRLRVSAAETQSAHDQRHGQRDLRHHHERRQPIRQQLHQSQQPEPQHGAAAHPAGRRRREGPLR